MKKISKIKRLFMLCLVFLLSINSFAAIVSDNDGSAFITKAEFDLFKNDFNSQIDNYKTSINSKIDGAIGQYLDGLAQSIGVFEPNIRDLSNVQWRDILVKIGTARTWSSGTTYTTHANYSWKATYDTILRAGVAANPTAPNQKCQLIWALNGSQGHGGSILSMYGLFDGGDYWKAHRWAASSTYDCPNMPMIRYHKNPFETTFENQQKMMGWFDYGVNFANAVSQRLDNAVALLPADGGDGDGTKCASNYGFNSLATNYNYAYAADAGPGRSANAFGIKVATTEAGTATSTVGWRPTKASTIIFNTQPFGNNYGQSRVNNNINGYTTIPTSTYFPLTTADEDKGLITNDPLHMMLLGDTNTQEVNYVITREDISFWATRFEWPEDCYKDFLLTDIVLKKVPINQHPGGTTNDWATKRSEDYITDADFASEGAFGFEKVPDTLVVSLPTKPHKLLKLLDSNFISTDGKRYITFGEGLCISESAPMKSTVTLKFDIVTNSDFATNGCKATIEICDKNFNDTGTVKYHEITSGATRLTPSDPTSTKWLLNTAVQNVITFDVEKNDGIYVRFSPNDKAFADSKKPGQNYVTVKNFSATYTKG